MVDWNSQRQTGRSWLNLKELQAGDWRSGLKARESSPPASLNSSISVEQPANGDIRATPCFAGLGRSTQQRRDLSVSRLPTQRMGEESSELRVALSKAEHEISRLNCEMTRLRQEQKLQLQEVNSAHEISTQRLKSEVETLEKKVKEENMRRREEVCKVTGEFERKIESLKAEYEEELREIAKNSGKTQKSSRKYLENRYIGKDSEQTTLPSIENVDISRFRRVPKANSCQSAPLKADYSVEKAEIAKSEERDTLEADQTADWKAQIAVCQAKTELEGSNDQSSLETELKQLIQRIE